MLSRGDLLSKSEISLRELQWEALPRLAVLAGPAGIGKTRACLDYFTRLVQESKNPFLRDTLYLLPSAEHRERILDLMLRKEGSGFFGERVSTFNRLMQEFLTRGTHGHVPFRFVRDAERTFLLKEIVFEKGGEYFSSVSVLTGFLEKVSEFIGELKESMVGLAAFREGMKSLSETRPEMEKKYEGLVQIYEAYERRLEALGLRDWRDGLLLLREEEKAKPDSPPPLFRHLFVDGFFDFSRSQLEFLRWLTRRSARVTLTLTIDLSLERKGLFEIPLETLRALEKLGFQAVDLSQEKNHRASSEALRHLERNLFREPLTVLDSSPSPLLLLEATGLRGEVEMIAREIRRLAKGGGPPPLHFSDVAVIFRRIGEYEGILRSVFREFQIPVEIHERERLRDSPLARTLVSFFEILLNGWRREDIFNFLKSSYVAEDYAHLSTLELQALNLGILSGKERWLVEMGDPLFKKIGAFEERFQTAKTVHEWIQLTEEVIQSFGLSRLFPFYEEKVRRDYATLKRLRALLEEIRYSSLSHGTGPQRFESFAKEFLGLIEVDLFSLHDRDKNRVQVYDVSLARQKEYKVLFLAGLLEKSFPVEIREDPLLSDEERCVVGLGERLPRQAVERYLFYVGLTRAREKVILSYPRFDLEGHEALPSFYVDEVKRLFAEPLPMNAYSVSQPLPRLEDAVEEREVERHLIRRLYESARAKKQRGRALTLSLYNRFLQRASFQTLLPRILFEPAAVIENPKVRSAFFPEEGIFKPTGLEAYGRCPYRYFASEVLRLEEKEEGIDAKEVGILLHEVLEIYWRERVEKGKRELKEPEQAKAFVRETLAKLLKARPLFGERRYRLELKKAQMEEWLSRLVERERETAGPFASLEPRYFELRFGFKGGPLGPLKLYDPEREEVKLRGKIDRVDLDPSARYALVIDYKTGGTFEGKDLEFGRALQLPLYLLAVQQHLKLTPLGAEIYQISSAARKGFYSREALEKLGLKSRSRSVFDSKHFNKILERGIRFSKKFAQGITQAQIPVRPRDCDPHCPFPSLCRIEKWRLPFIYAQIREEDKKDGIV